VRYSYTSYSSYDSDTSYEAEDPLRRLAAGLALPLAAKRPRRLGEAEESREAERRRDCVRAAGPDPAFILAIAINAFSLPPSLGLLLLAGLLLLLLPRTGALSLPPRPSAFILPTAFNAFSLPPSLGLLLLLLSRTGALLSLLSLPPRRPSALLLLSLFLSPFLSGLSSPLARCLSS
jgi:hypothetical protein